MQLPENKELLFSGRSQESIVKSLTRQALALDPYAVRLDQHAKTVDESVADARQDKDAKGVAALVGVDLRALELRAKLDGRLESTPSNASVNIRLIMPAQVPGECGGQIIDAECESVE